MPKAKQPKSGCKTCGYEFSNCEDVLGPDEARAIMAAQDRAAAGRGGASLPPRPADLPANNHMSATAGPPAEEDEIPF